MIVNIGGADRDVQAEADIEDQLESADVLTAIAVGRGVPPAGRRSRTGLRSRARP